MADIQLRFGKDMLVLSAPVDETLALQGIDVTIDLPYLILMEPDTISDALHLQMIAGAQCLVTPTHMITPAQLAYENMRADGALIAQNAVNLATQQNPQHILVDIGPCGLPLDASSKTSLNENKKQYHDAARFFDDQPFDAFFLNGFTSLDDLRCALMGVRQVCDKPIFASVTIGSNSLDPDSWPYAIDIMLEYEASVIGFETVDPLHRAFDYATTAREATKLPVLASLKVVEDPCHAKQRGLTPLHDLQEYTPDTLFKAGEHLRQAGVQFLRATGNALAAHTGSLVAATGGLDVIERR